MARAAAGPARRHGGRARGRAVPRADCPVCGSAEHPRPAAASRGAADRQQEDAAAAVLAAAEERRVAAAAAHAACDRVLSAARAGAGGDVPLPDLVAAHDTAAPSSTPSRPGPRLPPPTPRRCWHSASSTRAGCGSGWHSRRRPTPSGPGSRTTATRLSQLRSGLDGARGDDPSVAARAARLGRLAAALEALARQVGAVEQLDDQVAAALERAERAAHGRGLDRWTSCSSRPGTTPWCSSSTRPVAATTPRSPRCVSSSPSRCSPTWATPRHPSSPGCGSRLSWPTQPGPTRSRRSPRRRRGWRRCCGWARCCATCCPSWPRSPRRTGSVDGLARLAEGKSTDNRLRMSLSGYVLAARLEQVAVSCQRTAEPDVRRSLPAAAHRRAGRRTRPGRPAPARARCLDGSGARPRQPVRGRELRRLAGPGPRAGRRRHRRGRGHACWRRCSSTRASAASTRTPSTR